MILIKEKGNSDITIQKPYEFSSSLFSILLQNTVTKEVYQFNVEDKNVDNKLFFNFEFDSSDLIDGEYYMVLISNPSFAPIEVKVNDIDDVKIQEQEGMIYFLVNKGDYITNGELYLTISPKTEYEEIKKITIDLLRVGDYKNPNQQYNNEQKYITYNGK